MQHDTTSVHAHGSCAHPVLEQPHKDVSQCVYQLELLIAQMVEQSIMASSLLLLAPKPPMT